MATYSVQPLPDTVDQRGSWQVKKGNRRVSTHVKKTAAVRRAKREAGSMDTVRVHRTDGTFQRTIGG